MPELPEVETVCRGLRATVVGRTIAGVTVRAPERSIAVSPSFRGRKFETILKGRRIERVDRRGKNILMRLSGGITLWVHLKMTGHFFYLDASEPIGKHDLVVFDFVGDDGRRVDGHQLRFNDYRRFGRLRVFADGELFEQDGLRDLGPEPLEIGAEEFAARARHRSRAIKAALLDQSFLAGVGNIYADEALFAARIHPTRLTGSLSRAKLIELHGHIVRLLELAIRSMGTSVDSYRGINGEAGHFQQYLKAYSREGEPCERCGGAIARCRIGARSAHFCPRCQRAR